MPCQPKSQARWAFANKPKTTTDWAGKTPSIKALPETKRKIPVPKRKKKASLPAKAG